MASSATAALRRTLPSRSVRILVSPTPITFAERRSVLQALQQFGPIEVFRMTPGYYSNYVSITKDVATAESLVTRSPLRYNLSTSQLDADSKPNVSSQTDSHTVTPAREASTNDGQSDKQFTLQIIPQRFYRHRFTMIRSPLSMPWPADCTRQETFTSATLKQILPPTVAAKGLAYWLDDLDSEPKETMKDTRQIARRWLPSVIAKGPEVGEPPAIKEPGRKPRSAHQSPNRKPGFRRDGLHPSHGDPWTGEREAIATKHPVGIRSRKAF